MTISNLLNTTPKQQKLLFFFSLAALVITAFLPSLFSDFTNWDDDWMLYNNHLVRKLTPEHIITGIFGNIYRGVYQPLVFLSFAVEYALFGLHPFVYHLDNLLLHVLNTFLVFIFINQLSAHRTAAFMAALFWSLSPLRVESVTWVTERKDLLYAFFYLLSLVKYVHYIKDRNKIHLTLSLLFFVFSCLSKLTAVSLSFGIVLLDYYFERKQDLRAIVEKAGYFSISLVVGIFSIWAVMGRGESAVTKLNFSVWERAQLVSLAFLKYLIKSVIPFNLAPFHPYSYAPGNLPGYYAVFFILMLALLGLLFWLFHKYKNKKVIFSGLFFVAAVVFALQILPVGDAAFADRNIYISSIGVAFLAGELFVLMFHKIRGMATLIFSGWLLGYGAFTFYQAGIWKDSITLFSDYIEKYPGAELGYLNRGVARFSLKDYAGSIEDFEKLLSLFPNNYAAILNRGISRQELGDREGALKDFNTAIRLHPEKEKAWFARGILHYQMNKFSESVRDLETVLTKRNESPFDVSLTLTHLARARIALKEPETAIADLNRAIEIIPDNTDAHYLRGLSHYSLRQFVEAVRNFDYVVKKESKHAKAYYYMALSQLSLNDMENACKNLEESSGLNLAEAQHMFLFYCGKSDMKEKLFYPNGKLKLRIVEGVDEKKDSVYLLCNYDSAGTLLKQGAFDMKTGKYNGEIRWYHPDGSLKKTGFSRDTVTYGEWKEYYPSGSLRAEYNYLNGELDGLYRHFYPDGKLWTERYYDTGRLMRVTACNNSQGKPLKTGTFSNGNGLLNVFNEKGEIILVQRYQNGILINK